MEIQRSAPIDDEVSSYQHDTVWNRLASLPRVPSNIAIIPETDELTIDDSTASLSSVTTRTETITSQCTAATSVLSVATIFRIQTFHCCPSMQVDRRIYDLWNTSIKHRLNGILLKQIPTGSCMQELMMVGKKPESLRPTIMLSCGDKTTKKSVEKVFKTLGWLQALLKSNNMAFIVLVGKTPLTGTDKAPASSNVEYFDENCTMQLSEDLVTFCGQLVTIRSATSRVERHCTFGGIILVDNIPHGLTVAHPFRDSLEDTASSRSTNTVEDENSLSDIDDAMQSDTDSEAAFYFNSDDDEADGSDEQTRGTFQKEDNLQNHGDATSPDMEKDIVPLAITQKTTFHTITDLKASDSTSQGSNVLPRYSPAVSSPEYKVEMTSIDDFPMTERDWAVLDMSKWSMLRPNKITHRDSRHDVHVQHIFQGDAQGEVVVLTGIIGMQMGYLSPSLASLKIGDILYDVQLITLEQVLPLGSSGAWVVINDMLCGFIIAARYDAPWAYMMPIRPVIEDMKEHLQTDNIRLPQMREWMVLPGNTGSGVLHIEPPSQETSTSSHNVVQPAINKGKYTDIEYASIHDVTSSPVGSSYGSTIRNRSVRQPCPIHGFKPKSARACEAERMVPERAQDTEGLQTDILDNQANSVSQHKLGARTIRQPHYMPSLPPVTEISLLPTSSADIRQSSPAMTYPKDYATGRPLTLTKSVQRAMLRLEYQRRQEDHSIRRRVQQWYRQVCKLRWLGRLPKPDYPALYDRPEDISGSVLAGAANVSMLAWFVLLRATGPILSPFACLAMIVWLTLRLVGYILGLSLYTLGCGLCHLWVMSKYQVVLDSPEEQELRLSEGVEMLGDLYATIQRNHDGCDLEEKII